LQDRNRWAGVTNRERSTKGEFDTPAFYAALDSQRIAKRLTWKDVAAEARVSASTLTRMSQGRRPDIDGLACLLAWSGLDANDFIKKTRSTEPEPLAQITAYLRADRNLKPESAKALEEIIRAAYERFREK
jgi:transcriptional regulator with XRE-family HTH domain